jgi:hypothetical protein
VLPVYWQARLAYTVETQSLLAIIPLSNSQVPRPGQVDTATLRHPELSTARCLVITLGCSGIILSTSAILLVSLSQSREALLLCHGVEVRSRRERYDIEERDPGVLGKELLRKSEGQGRYDPADLHDRHEASLPSGMDLVECPRASDDGHGDEVHAVLDRSNLSRSY